MRRWFFFQCVFVLLISCNGSDDAGELTLPSDEFKSVVTIVDTLYPTIDKECAEIMERMEMCTLTDTILTLPPCSSDYFRIFDYRSTKDWSAGFIVEMIPGLFGTPVHQLVIIEEHMGKYRIVNQYLGHMIELRTTVTGYSDLLVGYFDPDVGLIAIRHEWRDGKYEPVDVEEINNHFVKPEMKDSVNNIFLPAFSAGH